MSSLEDSSQIFRYHREMISRHGTESSFALGWLTPQDQQARFAVLAGIADLNGRSVLDAGCGYADLYPFLLQRYPDLAHYTGVEQIPELANKAIRCYGHLPGTDFIGRSFLRGSLPLNDYALVSGSLNYGSSLPGYIYQAIDTLFSLCRRGLGFNLLSATADEGLLVAYEAGDILAYCRTLSDNIKIVKDYVEDDFTIFMYKS